MVVVQGQPAPQVSLISQSEQVRVDSEPGELEKRPLCSDRPNHVHIPLSFDLDTQHGAFIVVNIWADHPPERPACASWTATIVDARACCSSTALENQISTTVGQIVGRFYSQLTIDTRTLFSSIQFSTLGQPW